MKRSSPAAVPPDVRDQLNQGIRETKNLAEWLAVDMEKLAHSVFPALGRKGAGVLRRIEGVSRLGVTHRLKLVGNAIAEAASGPKDDMLVELAGHHSDVVRQWAVYAYCAVDEPSLSHRLKRIRGLAADTNMTVRECAWMAFRPHFAAKLDEGIEALEPLVHEGDFRLRRFAVEASRPRSVWGRHIPQLKCNPCQGLPLLEPVSEDPHRYVQTAVANWLNDASKTKPEWTLAVCQRWRRLGSAPTEWIIRRALRTCRRNGQVTKDGAGQRHTVGI